MRFNGPLLLACSFSLTLTAASPPPVFHTSAPSSHSSVLQARGGCLSCNKPPSPPSHASKPHSPPNLGRMSMDRPMEEAADRGHITTSNGRPRTAAPPFQEPLGSASSYSPPGNLPMSDKWIRRLDRIRQVDPDFKHDDSAASSRWSSGARIVPRAPQGIFGRKKYSDPSAFGPGNSKSLPEGGNPAKCIGLEQKHCEENCYCDNAGNFFCDRKHGKSRDAGTWVLLLKAMCGPPCVCPGPRGVLLGAQLTDDEFAKVKRMLTMNGLSDGQGRGQEPEPEGPRPWHGPGRGRGRGSG
jgi:hypothetical protein